MRKGLEWKLLRTFFFFFFTSKFVAATVPGMWTASDWRAVIVCNCNCEIGQDASHISPSSPANTLDSLVLWGRKCRNIKVSSRQRMCCTLKISTNTPVISTSRRLLGFLFELYLKLQWLILLATRVQQKAAVNALLITFEIAMASLLGNRYLHAQQIRHSFGEVALKEKCESLV